MEKQIDSVRARGEINRAVRNTSNEQTVTPGCIGIRHQASGILDGIAGPSVRDSLTEKIGIADDE